MAVVQTPVYMCLFYLFTHNRITAADKAWRAQGKVKSLKHLNACRSAHTPTHTPAYIHALTLANATLQSPAVHALVACKNINSYSSLAAALI